MYVSRYTLSYVHMEMNTHTYMYAHMYVYANPYVILHKAQTQVKCAIKMADLPFNKRINRRAKNLQGCHSYSIIIVAVNQSICCFN